uniref:Mechanosensitive ion channel MscS domain-containing protein n=1 Tax=Attheya septentrionalis TaxID=420275 RepID=A0A6T7I8N1_9STRA
MQYRQALTYMDTRHPFSDAFGPAKTRAECVESAQNTYLRLLKHTPEKSILPFETLSLIAVDNVGGLEQKKTKSLVKIFRPDGKGELKLLDFVKACDSVYKELRLFRAGTANSSQIDLAFESIVNVLFFFLLGMLVLTIMELDPLALFLSLSGLLLSFAFMFGSAAAKYFEGILLIFVRRPYDIGDRIALSDVNKDTSPGGSATWFVEGVNLFTTTVRYAASNEVATLANGSLATSRIINGARSPKAVVYVYIKFSVDVSYNRIKIFKSAVEGFVKARPSEWVGMTAFRPTTIEIDRAYVEYMIALQHRNRWQDIGPILQSKADIASFSLELSKKLDMRYIAPALPVNMSLNEKTQRAFLNIEPEQTATDRPVEQPSDPTLSPAALDRLSAIFKPEKKK